MVLFFRVVCAIGVINGDVISPLRRRFSCGQRQALGEYAKSTDKAQTDRTYLHFCNVLASQPQVYDGVLYGVDAT
jgi:hypothetical protein